MESLSDLRIKLAVGAVIEDPEGYILLLLRHDKASEPGTWGLPGGKLEHNETPIEGLIREIFEELKLKFSENDFELIRDYHWVRPDENVKFYVYILKLAARPDIKLNLEDSVDSKWCTPKEAYKFSNLMRGMYPILQDRYGLKPKS